MEVKIGL